MDHNYATVYSQWALTLIRVVLRVKSPELVVTGKTKKLKNLYK